MNIVCRLLKVVALVLFTVGAVFVLMPASVSVLGTPVGCNPASISSFSQQNQVFSQTQPSGTSYLPALAVWLDPSLVVPSGSSQSSATSDVSVCRTAAQNELRPAVILFSVAIVLLISSRERRTHSGGTGGWVNISDI